MNIQRFLGQIAEHFAQYTACRAREAGREMEVDMRQRSARQDQEHQPDQTPGEKPAAPLPRLMAMAKHLPGLDRQQQREDVGEIAQNHEQNIGTERTCTSCGILHLCRIAAGVAPAGIALIVGQQGHHQIQAQCAKGDQGPFLEPVVQLLSPERDSAGCWGGFLQNALFPAR